MLKALFFLGYLHFINFMVKQKNNQIRKLRLISKFMSQTEQQIITIKILHNICKSKDNQPMKFSQLMKYNLKNTFLQKPCRK